MKIEESIVLISLLVKDYSNEPQEGLSEMKLLNVITVWFFLKYYIVFGGEVGWVTVYVRQAGL